MDLLIVGAGGHGKVVKEIAEDLGYQRIAFIDDNSQEAIGKIENIRDFLEYKYAFCGIGNNVFREKILNQLENDGFLIPTLIHPTAYVSRSAKIEKGTVVEPCSKVNANSCVGKGCIVSLGSTIDHDVEIDNFVHVNSGAIVKAGAKIGAYTKLEAGEIVLGYESAVVKKR